MPKKLCVLCLLLLLSLTLLPAPARAQTASPETGPQEPVWEFSALALEENDVYRWRVTIYPEEGTVPELLYLPAFRNGDTSLYTVGLVTDRGPRVLAEGLPANVPAEVPVTGLAADEQITSLVILVDMAPAGFGTGSGAGEKIALRFARPAAAASYTVDYESGEQAQPREVYGLSAGIAKARELVDPKKPDAGLLEAIAHAEAFLDNPFHSSHELAVERVTLEEIRQSLENRMTLTSASFIGAAILVVILVVLYFLRKFSGSKQVPQPQRKSSGKKK